MMMMLKRTEEIVIIIIIIIIIIIYVFFGLRNKPWNWLKRRLSFQELTENFLFVKGR